MPKLDPSFSVKKPVSVWNQPLKADYRGLFGSLAKATLHSVTGQWTELGVDATEGMTALGVEQDAPQLSWLLIRRALLAAMSDLVQERGPLASEPESGQLKAISQKLDDAIEGAEVTIDRMLFERPDNLPLLAEVRRPFSEWLQALGLSQAEGDSTAARLPSYFVLALHNEWRRSPSTYEPIRTEVETPFTAAAERERAWALYAARLQRQVDEPMFGEAFGLRQVYVPLRAYYVEESEGERLRGDLSQQQKERRVAVDLEQEIDDWLTKGTKADAWRILSGGPGSGKSSFGKMYASKLVGQGKQLLFIPLHQFNVSGSLSSAIGDFVRATEILPDRTLEDVVGQESLFIIFDGLDELSLQGRLAAEVARDFLREVQKTVETWNQQRRRLLVLITGREPVVQANASELRNQRLLLHALPYLVLEGNQGRATWQEGSEILAVDQRHRWWHLYAVATGRTYDGLPKELARRDLDEITAQPLLNYLVALSYDRGQLDFSRGLNLNDIYEDLLGAVHSRTYEERQHLAIRGMNLNEFTRVLEEIALAAWHGNGRTTTVAEIEQHCQTANLSGLLERFEEGAKAGVTRVLTAFYFREFGRTSGGDRTFEFTHKSFREYLTALRIIRALQRMELELARQQDSFDDGWSDRDAIGHWVEICGPNPMDPELFHFVQNQVEHIGADTAIRWQKMLCRLISATLRNGMPMELLSPRLTFQAETQQGRNAEEALLTVLYACASQTKALSRIEWPSSERETDKRKELDYRVGGRNIAGAWISRLRGQREGGTNGLALRSLAHLDLSNCILDIIDLYSANLYGSNLDDATLFYASLANADLSHGSLRRTILQWANLMNAQLSRADLTGATLIEALMRRADLTEANIKHADLGRAYLRGAIMRHADLTKANLSGADLTAADLSGANLTGANLSGANLTGANLLGADLSEANLAEAQIDRGALANTTGTPTKNRRS